MTRYHLRFQLLPGRDTEADAVRLARFSQEHGIDEVVLMTGAEEFHTGHPRGLDEDLWYSIVAAAVGVLRKNDITASLNPWITVGHTDRGRIADGFAPMVSPAGEVATATASFACPRWRAWVAAHYGRFAGLGFRVLWLEDDFRYHNHEPLTWGGGFEPEMLERFAELAGAPVTREELVAAVTAPGEPHPWRALLLRTWRTAQLEVVEAIRKAVGERARLGLMSSGLGVASVEGRDWSRLFQEISVHRPHFAPYRDSPAHRLSYSIGMLELQRALRPAHIEVAPEVENAPHTAWAKSDVQTWSEMVAAALAGSGALLLDVFPFHAGVPQRYPAVGEMLARSRPALDRAATTDLETLGVGIPWWPETAARLHTRRGGSMDDLTADPLRAADYLLGYGVPIRAGAAPITALFGDVAWGVPDDELRGLLKRALLLDGEAAAILTDRGYGDLLGVRVLEIVDRDEPTRQPYALERSGGEFLGVNTQPFVARLEPGPGAEVWTEIRTPRDEQWGAGRVAAINSWGGRVVTLAAGRPEELGRCDNGRRLAHRAMGFLGADFPLVSGGPYLMPQLARTGSGTRLAIVNGSADPVAPRIDGLPDGARATLLAPLEKPCPAAPDVTIPHRGYLLVEW